MKYKLFLYMLVLAFSSAALAEEDKYKICFVNGYYSGAEDRFLSGLATYIQMKKGLVNDPLCSAAHRTAYEVGVHYSRTGKVENETDYKILKYTADFSSKVYEVVSSKMNY